MAEESRTEPGSTPPGGPGLPLSWNWPLHLGMASAAAVLLIAVMVLGRPVGWVSVVLVILLAWGLFAANVWLRRRARMIRRGRHLWVRRLRRWHAYDGVKVRQVNEVTTWSGVCYRITTEDGVRALIPAALFNGGHSTVLGWVLDLAPSAAFDRAARRSVVHLHERGLLEHHTVTFDEAGRPLPERKLAAGEHTGNSPAEHGTGSASQDVGPTSPAASEHPGTPTRPNLTEQT